VRRRELQKVDELDRKNLSSRRLFSKVKNAKTHTKKTMKKKRVEFVLFFPPFTQYYSRIDGT
jgi:hypothetical protein